MEIVTQQQVGYSFSVNIESETRRENSTKYPDKQVISARISGHELTYEDVVKRLAEAKIKVKEILEK